jgi:TetR/AcrR family transcriptional repressor of bet genes
MSRRPNTDERRAQIVAALLAVMAKHGYDGASIADIAAKARLVPGLVHYHFASKLEILVEATLVLAADHERVLDRAVAGVRNASEALAAIVDVHLGLGAHADPERLACWIQIAGEAIRHPQVRAEFRTVIASLARRIENLIDRGIDDGELACDAPAAAGAAITATIEGYFVMAATARDVIPPGSAAACTTRMLGALVQPVTDTRSGTRSDAGSGTRSGTRSDAGSGTRSGTRSDTRSGTRSDTRSGTRSVAGTRAGSRAGTRAGTRAGSRTGSSTRSRARRGSRRAR